MSHRPLFPTLLLACLMASACQADRSVPEPTAPDAAAPAKDAPAAPGTDGTDASAVVHHESADPAGFDRKAFAGDFAGTLPCADCPGIEMQLAIDPDGSFVLDETYQERDASFETRGTWTVEDQGRRLRLDPDSKDEPDRLFQVVSRDELRMLDSDGQPVDSPLNYSLRRR